eukprot:NODE_4620_length_762_cov_63.368504_g4461_i0.p1 GENE.NODE_4620_length_762_cov_63.368504_g4461_i0~~NODE_4620_length_762_cov_63.368504_g4461_i0.p1  ORF type:complete len:230 (+),score=55.51 NODE_4620_length_762_cov_63.368504_g4461_i0:26-715(+)
MSQPVTVTVRFDAVAFVLPLSTLHKAHNLKRMLGDDWEYGVVLGDGSFKILHSPLLFPLLLRMLGGNFDMPSTEPEFCRKLMDEIEFYGCPSLRGKLADLYPWAREPDFIDHDSMVFSIRTPSVSGLAPDEFNYVSPDNLLRAFWFQPYQVVRRYHPQEHGNVTTLVLEVEGQYERLPARRVRCTFPDLSCCFLMDAKGTIVLEYNHRVSKAIVIPHSELIPWLRVPVE